MMLRRAGKCPSCADCELTLALAAVTNVRMLRSMLNVTGVRVGRSAVTAVLSTWKTHVTTAKTRLLATLVDAYSPDDETDTLVLYACAAAHPKLVTELVRRLHRTHGYTATDDVAQSACAMLVRRTWRDGMHAAVVSVVSASAPDFDPAEFTAFALGKTACPPTPRLQAHARCIAWSVHHARKK